MLYIDESRTSERDRDLLVKKYPSIHIGESRILCSPEQIIPSLYGGFGSIDLHTRSRLKDSFPPCLHLTRESECWSLVSLRGGDWKRACDISLRSTRRSCQQALICSRGARWCEGRYSCARRRTHTTFDCFWNKGFSGILDEAPIAINELKISIFQEPMA